MPGRARKDHFEPNEIGVYHCYNRCVRQAFLCGREHDSGEDHSHRKDWVCSRLELLASVFAIDVATHSAMDNHIHVVIRNRPDLASSWSDEQVVRRWLRLDAKRLELRAVDEKQVEAALRDPQRVAQWRLSLSHISEFMRMLDEPIARAANVEDEVRGHFWEGRFRSQRLLDEASILACSVYVDLNPIRAMLAETPETSRYTSAYARIHDWAANESGQNESGQNESGQNESGQNESGQAASQEATSEAGLNSRMHAGWLTPVDVSGDGYDGVAAGRRASDKGFLPMSLDQYLEFLDWTGREVREGKAGAIPSHLAPILERLGVRMESWKRTVTEFGRSFGYVVGRAASVAAHAAHRGRQFWRGTGSCRSAFA